MKYSHVWHPSAGCQISFIGYALKLCAYDESECEVPCICGYYGRACRQMNDKADRMLCTGCALAEFSK